MKKIFFLLFLLSLSSHYAFAQQTVGLFQNSEEAFNGYTLFSPQVSTETYLIDNCGEKVHSWASDYFPGLSSYLLENGVLLRAGRQTGGSNIIEMIDWDGNVIWSYSPSLEFGRQHHDFEYLPNGNILLIVWDRRTKAEVEQAGSSTNNNFINSEQVIEIKPDLVTGQTTLVWQWKAWDHLIQDQDDTKDNYGVISQHPERIDINFLNHNDQDWLHYNGIDYNEELDQIILSTRNFDEFWIIDHSTSIEEAATSSGGKYNKGGDLLYRWGNPITYDRGDESDQKLFSQHHAHWILKTYPDGDKILVFNNQAGSPQNMQFSTVDIIDLPVDENGFYTYNDGPLQPSDFEWTYQASNPSDFYSRIISGAQRLENGNTLICEGTTGRFFEINEANEIVWEYINPVNNLGPIEQNSLAEDNGAFRCIRYSPDYSGLEGRELIPQGYIETGSTIECTLEPTSLKPFKDAGVSVQVYPNPASDYLKVSFNNETYGAEIIAIRIYNVHSKIVYQASNYNEKIDLKDMINGLYYIQIETKTDQITKKIIIH